MTPFFEPGPVIDERYSILRDGDLPIIAEGRAFVEMLWSECHPYLDPDLPSAAKLSYLPRFWELYVCGCLIHNGRTPVPRRARMPKKSGPDLLLRDPKVWVEAVLPTSGSGADSPPAPIMMEAQSVPDDQVKLRFRQAIEEKHLKHQSYINAGWVQPSDPYVIAVGGAGVYAAHHEVTIPRIIRCVLPFGHERVHLDRDTFQVVGHSFAHQPVVIKTTGGEVSTDLFLNAAYSNISGILYGWADEINRPPRLGAGCTFIHNPLASSPVPRGIFQFGQEYWVENNQLSFRDYDS